MNKKLGIGIVMVLFAGILATNATLRAQSVEHNNVYYEEGRFAGWPANHGVWTWGEEILVGFVASDHKAQKGHTYNRSIPRDKYGRSKDGGQTWVVEDAYHRGQTGWRYNNRLEEDQKVEPVALTEPINFEHPDLALTFLRQTNNIGPSHFYYSYNRGQKWMGPYALPNFGTQGVATRTDYIVDSPNEITVFLTVAKSNKKEGRILCVRTKDGGLNWEKVGFVGPEPDRFQIMSSSIRLDNGDLLTTIRARTLEGKSSIASFSSTDNGVTWTRNKDAVANTGTGGSPPALVKMKDNTLALGYIVRQENGSRVCVTFSKDNGKTWGPEHVLRADGANRDVGYPRMVQRPDGNLVIIYYWNTALSTPDSPYRHIASTTFDPKEFLD